MRNPVLPEHRLAVKPHQGNAPVTGCSLGIFIGLDDALKAVDVCLNRCIKSGQIKAGPSRCVFEMVTLMPVFRALPDDL